MKARQKWQQALPKPKLGNVTPASHTNPRCLDTRTKSWSNRRKIGAEERKANTTEGDGREGGRSYRKRSRRCAVVHSFCQSVFHFSQPPLWSVLICLLLLFTYRFATPRYTADDEWGRFWYGGESRWCTTTELIWACAFNKFYFIYHYKKLI